MPVVKNDDFKLCFITTGRNITLEEKEILNKFTGNSKKNSGLLDKSPC